MGALSYLVLHLAGKNVVLGLLLEEWGLRRLEAEFVGWQFLEVTYDVPRM